MDLSDYELMFIKKLQKNENNINFLISDSGLTRSILYDVNNKRRKLSYEVFCKIMEHYNIDYNFDDNILKEAHDLIIDLFIKISKQNNEAFFKSFESIDLNKYEHSKAFIYVNIFKALYSWMNDDRKTMIANISDCKNYIDLYDNNIGFLYGLICMVSVDVETNIDYLDETMYGLYNKYSLNNLNKHIEAMFYYQLGRLETIKGEDIFLSLDFYKKAVNAYQSLSIIDRVLRVKIQEANCYGMLKQYKRAIQEYLEVYDIAEESNNYTRMSVCCDNLAFIYLLNHEYDNCLKYVEFTRKLGSKLPDLDYYNAYISYKQLPKRNARTKVKGYIEKNNNDTIIHILKLIRSMINENDDKVDYYFRLIRQDCINMKLNLDLQLVYEMVLEYYEGNDVKCVPLLKEYINFIR